MDFGLDEINKEEKIFTIINNIITETNFFKRLQATEVIYNMLDDNIKKKFEDDLCAEIYMIIDEKINNINFMREAMRISEIIDNPETCIEYYDRDYLGADNFKFDKDFELEKRTINKKINEFLGQLLKILFEKSSLDLFGKK